MFDGCALLGVFCLHGFSGYWRTSDASVTEGAFFYCPQQEGKYGKLRKGNTEITIRQQVILMRKIKG